MPITDTRQDVFVAGPCRTASAVRDIASVREVRLLKRFVQAGVYSAIFCLVPVFIFILGFSVLQEAVNLVIGLMIATSAIEGAFSQMFKLRKRSSYPGIFFLELGSQTTAADTAHAALVTIRELLGADAAFIATVQDGQTQILASDGVAAARAQEFAEQARVPRGAVRSEHRARAGERPARPAYHRPGHGVAEAAGRARHGLRKDDARAARL